MTTQRLEVKPVREDGRTQWWEVGLLVAIAALGLAEHRPSAWLPAVGAVASAVDLLYGRAWKEAGIRSRTRAALAPTILATVGLYASCVLALSW